MIEAMKMGLVLLAVGGAFWAGARRGLHQANAAAVSDRDLVEMYERQHVEWVKMAQREYNRSETLLKDAKRFASWNEGDAAELRDCNDAMYMWIRALEQRAGGWDDRRQLPGFRYLNPEGEVVTYHVPPLRKRTGSLHIGPDTLRREAGYVATDR